ncbi:hypothetical protein C8F04DRAFT_678587 [Mycena alexandri]|uniref:Uncharacterized protein n=1 Tax=Mycena alexandri TaxID=1745969 RepID=A0AAD6XCY6_9AGAR|nr:hypothetical protein C8F04DRAFT_678587 [Mycena alexandri]
MLAKLLSLVALATAAYATINAEYYEVANCTSINPIGITTIERFQCPVLPDFARSYKIVVSADDTLQGSDQCSSDPCDCRVFGFLGADCLGDQVPGANGPLNAGFTSACVTPSQTGPYGMVIICEGDD